MILIEGINSNDKLADDKKISLFIMSPFVILMLQNLLLYYFNLMNTTMGELVQLTSKLLVCVIGLFSISIVLKRISRLFVNVYIISILIFLLTCLFFPQNIDPLKGIMLQYFFSCLPCFLYSYSLEDRKEINIVIEKASFFIYMIGLIIGFLMFTNKMNYGQYNVSFGTYMLLPAVIYLNKFFNHYNIRHAIIALTSIFMITIIGSRGPIMCISLYIIIYQLIHFKRISYKNIALNFSIWLVTVLAVVNLELILNGLINFFDKYGINSRSLSLFQFDKIHLSGRENIYSEIIYQIREHPFVGIGITGDRYYTGGYSHNILLEIISGFGILLGSLIIMILCFIIVQLLFLKDKKVADEVLIWLTIGLFPLFVSNSYLTYFQFWIFLGITFRYFISLNKISNH